MKRTIVYLLALATLPVVAQEKVNKWDITKVDVSKLPPAASDKGVTYDKDIAPILKASCVGCHGGQKPRANLHLDSKEGILKGGKDGAMVVVGDSSKSLLIAAAAQIDDKIAMPPKHRGRGPGGPGGAGGPPPGGPPPDGGQNANPGGPPPGGAPPPGGPGGGPGGPGGPGGHPPPKPLTADQVGLLRAWIDQGAN